MHIYDPAANVWSPGPPLPFATVFSTGGAAGGAFYVFGGAAAKSAGMDRQSRWLVQVQRYDPASSAWSSATPLPAAVAAHSSAAADGVIYLLGGKTSANRVTGTVLAYIP
jgi:hypothetical protein